MSKTFKSAVTITGSRNLLVSTDIGMDAGFFLEVRDKHEEPQVICFENRTAPALALAILEAAGHVRDACSDNDADVAMEWLHSAIARQAKQSAEAKEQAELEAEALELANAFNKTDWDFFPCNRTVEAHQWLAVARRAREMSKESTNGR